MRKTVRIVVAAVSASLLCFALAGCGCSADNSSSAASSGATDSASGVPEDGVSADDPDAEDADLDDAQTDVQDINTSIADDDMVSMTLVSKAMDAAGYVGFNVEVTNKTDRTLSIGADIENFTVNGTAVSPFLDDTLAPSSTVTCFVTFDKDAVASVDDLVNVQGILFILDDPESSDAEYDYNVSF